MKRARDSLPASYFEQMYAGNADPWGFETSAYEQAKYDHTISVLCDRRYGRAFEIGCANGVLTKRLAAHCGELLAIDVSPTALARARERCRDLNGVRFDEAAFPLDRVSAQPFDLIVLSEVAYYWDDADLARAAAQLSKLLAPNGDLLLVHWTGETDYPQSGDDAVEALKGALSIEVVMLRRECRAKYRLDLWRRIA